MSNIGQFCSWGLVEGDGWANWSGLATVFAEVTNLGDGSLDRLLGLSQRCSPLSQRPL